MQTCRFPTQVSYSANTTGDVQGDDQPVSETPPEQPIQSPLTAYTTDEAATLMNVVLDSELMTRQDAELADKGFTRTGDECPVCAHGALWSHDHEVICDCCSVVFDEEERRRRGRAESQRDRWASFRTHRDFYQSGHVRLPGGYPHVYEWVERDELDEGVTIANIEPTAFYK